MTSYYKHIVVVYNKSLTKHRSRIYWPIIISLGITNPGITDPGVKLIR